MTNRKAQALYASAGVTVAVDVRVCSCMLRVCVWRMYGLQLYVCFKYVWP
jgi:hypothetical protein